MTFVFSSRQSTDLPYAGLVAHDELAALDEQDLALNNEELRTLLEKRLGRQIEEADVTRILEVTEGWVTGVLLSEELVSESLPATGDPRKPLLHEYLAQEVFDKQPPNIQQFLLDSAILPIMTAEACDLGYGKGGQLQYPFKTNPRGSIHFSDPRPAKDL